MSRHCTKPPVRVLICIAIFCIAFMLSEALAQEGKKLSLNLQNVDIAEVMEMLSRNERANILLSKDIEGEISLNLYDVTLDQAIRLIVAAAGFAVEYRDGSYIVLKREDSGKYAASGLTELRTFKVEYSDPDVVEGILKNYLSEYGKITMLLERKLLVVEDLPTFIDRIEELLKELDRQPRQMLIEAKILEITLQDAESFGIKWAKFFSTNDGTGALGTKGLNNPLSPGLFIDIITPDLELFLDALRTRDRLRTLSTPKLLALEHQEAEAIIGDRIGYRVTTTINQVTTESIEFLESGVILKVMPSVDGQGRILLDIHPEVSTGTVSDDGIPSQKTTEVTTQMLVGDGQTVFIGGLIKRTMNQSKEGVPLLGDIPIVGGLFANNARNNVSVETVVLITPYLINEHGDAWNEMQIEKTQTIDRELRDRTLNIDSYMDTKEKPLIEQSVTTNTAVDISQQSDIFLLGDW